MKLTLFLALVSVVQCGTIVQELLERHSEFSNLTDAVIAANLTSVLNGTGPFTVFAPNNKAFTSLLRVSPDALENSTFVAG